MKHGTLINDLIKESEALFFVSPYITADFEALFKGADFSSVKSFHLVTTLKKNDQDQITKPNALKSFYQLIKAQCPKAKVKVHIDNSLHGKMYIFKKPESLKAIVTSANLTHNGFYHNHEWGLLSEDKEINIKLEDEVLQQVEYAEITESLVDRLIMFSDQYQSDNPEWTAAILPTSDILDNVYFQGANNNDNPRYWLKPIGVSEEPILKEDKKDFSDLHQNLSFSKKGVGAIRAGDIVITTAVGCGCLLSYFQITGSPKEASHEEKEKNPDKVRWPWHIEGRSLSTEYGGHWWDYDLNRNVLLNQFLETYPDKAVTATGARTLGTLNFGSDKVELTKEFSEFFINCINNPK